MLTQKIISNFLQKTKTEVLLFCGAIGVSESLEADNRDGLLELIEYDNRFIHSINTFGGIILYYAIEQKAYACTLLLLEKGAEPNALNWDKRSNFCYGTSLHRSVRDENNSLTRLLLIFGADKDKRKPLGGEYLGNSPYVLAKIIDSKELLALIDVITQSEQARASLMEKEASIKASVDLTNSERKAATKEQLESLLDIQEKLAGIWDDYVTEEEIPCLVEYYKEQRERYEARALCYRTQLNPKPITEQEVNSDLKQSSVFFKPSTQPKQRTINKEVYQAIPNEEDDSFSYLDSNKLPF